MSLLKFINNKEVTLIATVNSGDTNLPIASLTADPLVGAIFNYSDKYVATLTNGTDIEIIHMVAAVPTGSPTSYTIVRGQEGTLALTWGTGDKLSLRVTGGVLNNFLQNNSNIDLGPGETYSRETPLFQDKAYIARADTATYTRANSTFVSENSFFLDTTGIYLLAYLQSGTTAASEPLFSNNAIQADGTAVVLSIQLSTTEGDIYEAGTSLGQTASAVGQKTLALGSKGFVSSGLGALANGDRAISMNLGKALADDSVAIGDGAAYGIESISLGETSFINRSFTTKGISSKPMNVLLNGVADIKTNFVSTVWSYPIDFSGGSTWTASTAYTHGSVVKPTTPDGNQYIRLDNNYKAYSKLFPVTYAAGISGTTEPTWVDIEDNFTFDGDGKWLCKSNTGAILTLPGKFLVKRIGIVLFDTSTITIQPGVSFGVSGNNTAFLSPTTTTNLTGNNKVQMFEVLNSELTTTLTYTINTPATAIKMVGQIFFEGFLAESWL